MSPDFTRVASVQGGSLKKAGFHTIRSEKKSCEYPKKIMAFWHPRKIRMHPTKMWVDFTGYPSNHISGLQIKRVINKTISFRTMNQSLSIIHT